MEECKLCGNVWDGNAQCTCYLDNYEDEEIVTKEKQIALKCEMCGDGTECLCDQTDQSSEDMEECKLCGNVWDGNAQCPCYLDNYDDEEIVTKEN